MGKPRVNVHFEIDKRPSVLGVNPRDTPAVEITVSFDYGRGEDALKYLQQAVDEVEDQIKETIN